MDETFTPRQALGVATAMRPSGSRRLALVLPTTPSVLEGKSDAWTVVGRCGQPDVTKATDVLRRVQEQDVDSIIIRTDQLHHPGDATVLILLEDCSLYLSPIEFILNDKYGYSLVIWTASGLSKLPPKSSFKDIGFHIAKHLQDCSLLKAAWLERDRQALRMPEYRCKARRRQLRFLQSSVANAYMAVPSSPLILPLLNQITEIEGLPCHEIAR